jgi:NADH:ubiquinone oxidoreductase subunit H
MALHTLVLVGILLGGLALFGLVCVYAERKISAFIQDQLGLM